MKRATKQRLYLMGCLMLFPAFLLSGINYSGYCLPEQRYLSEIELFKAAIGDGRSSFNGSYWKKISAGIGDKERGRRIDAQAAEFLAANPECCEFIEYSNGQLVLSTTGSKAFVGGSYIKPSFWGRITGSKAYIVEIKYFGKKQNSTTFDKLGPRHLARTVGNCGKVYDYSF